MGIIFPSRDSLEKEVQFSGVRGVSEENMDVCTECLKIGQMEKQVSCGKSSTHGSLPSLC